MWLRGIWWLGWGGVDLLSYSDYIIEWGKVDCDVTCYDGISYDYYVECDVVR